jgi:chromosome segregation ATPase
MDEATKEAFAELTQGMERGFAAVSEDFASVREDIGALGHEVKADIASLREQTTGIEQELKSIRVDLNDLLENVANIAGYRKEIDHAFERIAAIEKHVGIYKRNAA